MLESVSPYALLRASIPKHSAVTAAPYDLYSIAQSSSRPASASPAQSAAILQPQSTAQPAPSEESEPETRDESPEQTPVPDQQSTRVVRSMPMMPTRKTHYISDIQNRHTTAANRTTFSEPPQH